MIYWAIFYFSAIKTLLNPKEKWSPILCVLLISFFVCFIGLRYRVGTDWANYGVYLIKFRDENLIFSQREFFFGILNYVSLKNGTGLFGVNFFCSIFFSTGLIAFCKNLPRPWLGLTIAIPYFVTVISIAYNRQAFVMGLLLLGILFLSENKKIHFFITIMIASGFHLTALINLYLLLPFYLNSKKLANNIFTLSVLLCIGGIIFVSLVSRWVGDYAHVWLNSGYIKSSGVYLRLPLVFFPSCIFLIFNKRFNINNQANLVWKSVSFYSILLAISLPFVKSTAIIDRLSLYALPILVFTGSYFPDLNIIKLRKTNIIIITIVLSALVQLVWFKYSSYSTDWLPYRNVLFYFDEIKNQLDINTYI